MHDVTFGDDPYQGPGSVDHWKAADPVGEHQPGRLLERGVDGRRHRVGGHQFANPHIRSFVGTFGGAPIDELAVLVVAEGDILGLAEGLEGVISVLDLQVGVAVTASTLQLGLAFAGVLAGLGLTLLLVGGGLIWAGRGHEEIIALSIDERIPEPGTV